MSDVAILSSQRPLIELWIREHTRITPRKKQDEIVEKVLRKAAKTNAPLDAVYRSGIAEADVGDWVTYRHMTVTQRRELDPKLLKNGIWMTKDCTPMLIRNMETTHIRYSIAKILFNPPSEGWRAGYVPLLTQELARRGDGR